eukprot:1158108-Pelagomonas_calceolata.AAC.3
MLTHLAVAGVHAHFHWPQLVLDLSSVKLAFFLLAHAGAETAFYLSVVAHSLPVAVLRRWNITKEDRHSHRARESAALKNW